MDIDFNSIGSSIAEQGNSSFLSTSVPQNNAILQQYTNQQQHNIGNYILGKTLGMGRFGCVKQATDSRTGKLYAIKFIDKSINGGRETSNQSNFPLKREAEMLKYLQHKNIVKLYEVLESPTQILLVMEYIHNGKDLFTLISRRGKLTESQAKVIFFQIVDAVKYCHSRYIVHRDIKCENIMVCEMVQNNQPVNNNNDTNISQDAFPFSMELEDNNISSQTQQSNNIVVVKLIDFGLSTSFQFPTRNDNTMWGGSIEYASPEVIFRRPFLGPEVDVWSCGVVLFVMTCGYLPFQGHNDHEIANKIKQGDFKFPIHLSAECKDLISSMLQVDPSQRAKIEDVQKHPWLHDVPINVSLEDGIPSFPMDTPSLNRSSFSHDAQASGLGLSQFKRSISDSEVYQKVLFPFTPNDNNNNTNKKTNNDNNSNKEQQIFQVPRKAKPKLKRQSLSNSPQSLLTKRTSPQDESELTDQSSAPMDQEEEYSKRSRFDF